MAPRLIRPERLKSHTACEKRWLRQLPPYQESTNHSCLLEQKVGITATSTNLQLKNSASWTPLNLHRTQKWVLPGKRKLTGSFWTSWSRSSKFLFFKKSFCLFVYLFGLLHGPDLPSFSFFKNLFVCLFTYLASEWRVACGILVPHQGSNLCLLQWKHRVLTTGPPGKPPSAFLWPQIRLEYFFFFRQTLLDVCPLNFWGSSSGGQARLCLEHFYKLAEEVEYHSVGSLFILFFNLFI